MPYLNKCEFIGNLGADPKEIPNSKSMLVMEISVGISYNKDSETTWLKFRAFGDKALFIKNNLTKGVSVYVSGRYECDKQGSGTSTKLWPKFILENVQKLSYNNKPAEIPFDTPSKAAHQKDPLHDTVPLDAYTQDLNEELNKELIYDE